MTTISNYVGIDSYEKYMIDKNKTKIDIYIGSDENKSITYF